MSDPRPRVTSLPPSRSSWAVLALVTAACGTADRADPSATAGSEATAVAFEAPAGPLVIVGGALDGDNDAVYEAILERSQGGGPLCVLPTASGVPRESMESAVAAFDRHGGPGTAEGILLAEEDAGLADDPALAARLEACSGFFFTGGAQSRVVATFLPAGDTSAALRALTARHRAGAVVAGSSAGAAMMSRLMIAGGSSDEALSAGVVGAGPEDAEGIAVRPGLDLFAPAVLDQHFLARGRIARLLVVALTVDAPRVGLGIDENTALVVDGATARVEGASGVVVVDAREASRTRPGRGTGVRVTLAGAGDAIDLRTFAGTRADDKSLLTPSRSAPTLPADPFARWAFLGILTELARSEQHEARFELDGATLRVARGPGFGAFAYEGEGVQGAPRGFSAGPFLVDLEG